MADEGSESLQEFAGMIQEKAGPVPTAREASSSGATGASDSLESLRSALDRQPRMVIAGIAAGIGAAFGYLVGKLLR